MSAQRKKLVEALNQDIAGELTAVMQYFYYGTMMTGVEYGQVKKDFLAHVTEEFGHAVRLASFVSHFGGEPVVEANPIKRAKESREMLLAVLEMEEQGVARYTKRVDQAKAAKEYALEELIEDLLVDEQEHVMELKDLLG